MNSVSLDQLTYEAFIRARQTTFRVWSNPQEVFDLELHEVSPCKQMPVSGFPNLVYEQFTVGFVGPAGPVLPQKIYNFESPLFGRFELFIVPISRQADRIRYEAAFNRQRKLA